jgi:TPR repeat protein
LDTLRKAAEAGDVDAMVSLANRYFDHKGDTYNFAEAMRWWKRAANSGNSSAMRVVGFQSGDPQEALRWYRKAAEAGDPQAMMDLPRISEKANVAMDVLEQARWRLEACKKGPWFRYDLRIDSRSLEVGVRKAMQDLLRSAGVYRGPSTGEFDEATLRALEDYYAKAPDMPPGAATDVNSTQSHGN